MEFTKISKQGRNAKGISRKLTKAQEWWTHRSPEFRGSREDINKSTKGSTEEDITKGEDIGQVRGLVDKTPVPDHSG